MERIPCGLYFARRDNALRVRNPGEECGQVALVVFARLFGSIFPGKEFIEGGDEFR